jgi:hypothetical protein
MSAIIELENSLPERVKLWRNKISLLFLWYAYFNLLGF